jgi:large subunit ribosomal protein L3
MRSGVIAQKVGMTRIFTEDGRAYPGDGSEARKLPGGCPPHMEKNGYTALQLGAAAPR